MLTADQINYYRVRGYLAVDAVFSDVEITELRKATDGLVERSRGMSRSDGYIDLDTGHSAENPRVRRLNRPTELHPAYRRALEQAKLLDIVGALIGPHFRYRGEKLNLKPGTAAAGPGPIKWSQAWAYYPHTNDDIVIAGIALDDSTLANGCLQAIPGTHRGPIYSHSREGAFCGHIAEEDVDFGSAQPIELRSGGVSFHHVRVLHGAGPNRTAFCRRLLLFQYCAGDAWPLLGGAEYWDTYAGSFLRGSATVEPRLVELPARIESGRPGWMPAPGGFDARP